MILSSEQLTKVIIENPNRDKVRSAREYNDLLRKHMYGDGLETSLTKIPGFEKQEIRDARAKYARSNKDLFSRLSRPIDKVFSAKGGSIYYNLAESQEKQARRLADSLVGGMSLRKWMEVHWRPHFLDDPAGLILVEILPQREAILAKQQNRSFVFPVYLRSKQVYDYLFNGTICEYLAVAVDKRQNASYGFDDNADLYRVIDDAYDYIVRRHDQSVEIVQQHTYPNIFRKVPAISNSDFQDPEGKKVFVSLFDDIIGLADDFLLDGSIKRVHKFMHGFPKYAEFADMCPTCNGSMLVEGEDCPSCKGSGRMAMVTPSSMKLLIYPEKDEPVITPDQVAAYISPDKTYFEISAGEMLDLENAMSVTVWGTPSRLKTAGMSANGNGDIKTATEIVDELKPQSDRLLPISEAAERREKFILDLLILVQVNNNYGGCNLSYGRRYMIEGADAIWEKYSNARTKGAPQNVLDTLLSEYYESNYQSDPMALAIAQKLMYVEPFVHMTVQQLKALDADPTDYLCKLYFSEWLALVNDAMLLVYSVEELKNQLKAFVADKKPLEPKPIPQPA
jgi:hypothetical protein